MASSTSDAESVSFILRLSASDAALIRKAVEHDQFVHRSEWVRFKLREAAEKSLKKT